MMDLHCKMNHIPFSALIRMAESGHINKRLAKVKDRIPVCLSCTFGMSHWRPWRSKGKPGTIRSEDEIEPGVCVSVDQLVSAQPGLIPQMSGYLTNLRIWGATVFVDHFSDYVYVALMRDLSLSETLNAKASFERYADQGRTSVQKYRADNGRFADKGFQDAVKNSNQKITYCAVGAHHQNDITERKSQIPHAYCTDLPLSSTSSLAKPYYNNDVAICSKGGSFQTEQADNPGRWSQQRSNLFQYRQRHH